MTWRGMTTLERIQSCYRVDPETGCWLWTKSLNPAGYGTTYVDGQKKRAHRVTYELLVGPIPDGLQIDHLCRVRHCVNPAHLEPVTCAENVRRGNSGRWQRDPVRCRKGHLYADGVIVDSRGWRHCQTCRRATWLRYWHRKNGTAA